MKVSKHPVLLVTLLAVDAVRCSSTAACNALQEALPGLVFFPGTEEYVDDNLHYTRGVSENSTCSVEPGTTDDVGTILRLVGSGETRSSFGVKGGGHTGNLGFSSTPGVQISLSKFTDLTFDNASSTVRLGAGLFWDEVYERLEPFGVKVIGGRVPGVGVSGLSLGGGYSYFTDQFGLTIDNIVSHDLVLPNGTFIEVTESSDPDLFFALKGGFNNFGIVTSFTVNAFPQTGIWISFFNSSMEDFSAVNQAVANWSANNTDSKATILLAYTASFTDEPSVSTSLLYDAPMQPDGIFDEFFTLPGADSSITGVFGLPEVLQIFNGALGALNPPRTARHTVPVSRYTPGILGEMTTQVERIFTEARAENRSTLLLSFVPEPFLQPNVRSTDSAYPNPPGRFVCPTALEAHWNDPADDEFFVNAVRDAQQAIHARTIEEGQGFPDDILYNNYAPAGTPLELLYGDNLERLRQIKRRIDPENVMGLSGGFKIE